MILKQVSIKGNNVNLLFNGSEYIFNDDSLVVSVGLKNMQLMSSVISEVVNAEEYTKILPDDKYLLSNILDDIFEERISEKTLIGKKFSHVEWFDFNLVHTITDCQIHSERIVFVTKDDEGLLDVFDIVFVEGLDETDCYYILD